MGNEMGMEWRGIITKNGKRGWNNDQINLRREGRTLDKGIMKVGDEKKKNDKRVDGMNEWNKRME